MLFDDVVPNRAYESRVGFVGLEDRTRVTPPASERPHTANALKLVKKRAEEWAKSVNDALDKIGKYRLQFNDPQEKGFETDKPDLTKNEKELRDAIDNMTSRVGELRKILTSPEQNNEQFNQSGIKDIEPPVYRKTKRTLFFAGKTIRFNKNAKYPPILCEVILSKPTKLWLLTDLLKYWDEMAYNASMNLPNEWQKVRLYIEQLNRRIEKKTGIGDLFDLNTTSVRVNPVYLKQTKK